MTTPPNLAAELISQLRDAKSPLARLRVVTRAWRLLRNLSKQDRLKVAAQIGIEGADDLVEAIAGHQGATPPAELIATINNIQKVDQATLKSLAAQMRDPKQRGKAVVQGLKAVEQVLTQPAAPPPPPPPKPAPAPITVQPATTWPVREAPAPAPAPAPVVETKPAPQPAPPPPPPPAPAPVRAPEPVAPPVRSNLAEGLAAVPVLTARFRLLRRRLSEARRLSPGDLRSILEAFPDGWARRRALVDLIESGAPERASDALSLLDALQSPGDRSWCLGALADSRKLTSEEREAVLQAAPTPAGRRRLELRLGEV